MNWVISDLIFSWCMRFKWPPKGSFYNLRKSPPNFLGMRKYFTGLYSIYVSFMSMTFSFQATSVTMLVVPYQTWPTILAQQVITAQNWPPMHKNIRVRQEHTITEQGWPRKQIASLVIQGTIVRILGCLYLKDCAFQGKHICVDLHVYYR